jgi:TP901 family phage tail tape measure protein
MNRSLVAQFILRLQDRASGGLDRIQGRLERITRVAQRLAAVGGILAGLSIMGPVREAAALERTMRDTAITAGLTGEAIEAALNTNLRLFQQVARDTSQRVRDLAQAAGTLVAGGGAAGEQWEILIPIIGRVATASGASANDLAESVLSLVNNLRLGAGQVEQALAAMVQAGREGQFELRDMAREFPSLTAAAAGLGMTGPQAVYSLAAALQVARQGAGTASEAATNLAGILREMASPTAVRAFAEMGVDLPAMMADAARRGINPLEALVQKVRDLTSGDIFRVGELFQNSAALGFLRPMIMETQRYMDVRDRAAATSPDLLLQGQADAMRGLDAALRRLSVAWDEFITRLGQAAEGPLTIVAGLLLDMLRIFSEWDAAYPGLLDNIALFGTGLTAAAVAVGGLGLVIGPLMAGLAALVSPIGLVVAGLAALAAAILAIHQNWDGIQGGFTAFTDWISGWVSGPVTAVVAAIRGPFDALTGWFSNLWQGMRGPFDAFITGVTERIERLRQAWDNLIGAQPEPTPAPGAQQGQRNWGNRARLAQGFYRPDAMAGAMAGGAPPPITITGEVLVRSTEGAEVVRAESGNPRVPFTIAPQNRGPMRDRP